MKKWEPSQRYYLTNLMIQRMGYEDHPMKVKVLLQLKLGTLNISSHTWWTNIACSRRERWRSSVAKMANGCIASQVRISSVADRSAESGAASVEKRRHWISWRGPRHIDITNNQRYNTTMSLHSLQHLAESYKTRFSIWKVDKEW